MKKDKTPKFLRGVAMAVGGVALFTGPVQAAPFLYSSGDLVLAFRQTGNASDYAVNIGNATNYNALPSGTTLVITNLSAAQLQSAFPSVNGISWSVAGANRPGGLSALPIQTLWVTAPRLDSAVQSPPWLRKGQFVQGTAASKIDAIGINAAASSSSQPAGDNNTVHGVVIPTGSDYAIGGLLGLAGDYDAFQGNVEAITADDFDGAAENVSRADLYEILPGTSADKTLDTPARYLGYFELKPDGAFSFNTGTPAIAAPIISGISRTGNVTSIAFSSTTNVKYRLRTANLNELSGPVSNWSTGATVTGDGSTQTLQDTSTENVRFFVIEIQP